MNGKRVKKLKDLAALFYQMQLPNMPNRQTLEQIYNSLKKVDKTNKKNGNQKETRITPQIS